MAFPWPRARHSCGLGSAVPRELHRQDQAGRCCGTPRHSSLLRGCRPLPRLLRGPDIASTSGGPPCPQGSSVPSALLESPSPLSSRCPRHSRGSRSPHRVSLPSALEGGPDPLRVSRSPLGPLSPQRFIESRSPQGARSPQGVPLPPRAPLPSGRPRSHPPSQRSPHEPAAIGPAPTWPRSRPALLPLAGGAGRRDLSAARPMGARQGRWGGRG